MNKRKLLASVGFAALSASVLVAGVSGAAQSSVNSLIDTNVKALSSGDADWQKARLDNTTLLDTDPAERTLDLEGLDLANWQDSNFEDFDFEDFDFEDFEDFDFDDFEFETWEPTAEEIAEINEWVTAEKAALDAAGITYTTETDEHGIQYLEWNETNNKAAWTALDELYETLIEDLVLDDFQVQVIELDD